MIGANCTKGKVVKNHRGRAAVTRMPLLYANRGGTTRLYATARCAGGKVGKLLLKPENLP